MSEVIVRAGRVLTPGAGGDIPDGAVVVDAHTGTILSVGPWKEIRGRFASVSVMDARDLVVCPGFIDCHAHNLEFGGATMWGVGLEAQLSAAGALALEALRAGVTALGEHVLGHPSLRRPVSEYREFARWLPQTVRIAVGSAVVGTDVLTCLCGLHSESIGTPHDLFAPELLEALASESEFPGENVFVTATCANLPVSLTPRTGELVASREHMARAVQAHRAAGQQIGAHLQGTDALEVFLSAGGDVVHHGHGLPETVWPLLAARGTMLCATPAGGTSERPNSPEEICAAVDAGVRVAIATDAVLPLHSEAGWYDWQPGTLVQSRDLLAVASPAMAAMVNVGARPNDVLSLITTNAAEVLRLGDQLGRIAAGYQADMVFTRGIPGLDARDGEAVQAVMIRGRLVAGSLF